MKCTGCSVVLNENGHAYCDTCVRDAEESAADDAEEATRDELGTVASAIRSRAIRQWVLGKITQATYGELMELAFDSEPAPWVKVKAASAG